MKINLILIILNIVGLIIALIWLMTDQTWEPLVTSLGLIASLVAVIFSKEKKTKNMVQKGGRNSTNYQSGGDININL